MLFSVSSVKYNESILVVFRHSLIKAILYQLYRLVKHVDMKMLRFNFILGLNFLFHLFVGMVELCKTPKTPKPPKPPTECRWTLLIRVSKLMNQPLGQFDHYNNLNGTWFTHPLETKENTIQSKDLLSHNKILRTGCKTCSQERIRYIYMTIHFR